MLHKTNLVQEVDHLLYRQIVLTLWTASFQTPQASHTTQRWIQIRSNSLNGANIIILYYHISVTLDNHAAGTPVKSLQAQTAIL